MKKIIILLYVFIVLFHDARIASSEENFKQEEKFSKRIEKCAYRLKARDSLMAELVSGQSDPDFDLIYHKRLAHIEKKGKSIFEKLDTFEAKLEVVDSYYSSPKYKNQKLKEIESWLISSSPLFYNLKQYLKLEKKRFFTRCNL